MRLSRRLFVAAAAAAAGLTRAIGLRAAVIGAPPAGAPETSADGDPLAALAPFLDTLIPADDTPAASAFGIDRRLRADAAARPARMRLVRAGCAWLDAEARRGGAADFAALAPAGREAIVARAAAAPATALPRVFYRNLRHDAFFHYYARPETWGAPGYDGPPQPNGFPGAAGPPR